MNAFRFAGLRALLAVGFAACMACTPSAQAHAVVKQSVPANGAVLDAAPKEVAITFNEKVEKMFTSATLKNASGATVKTPKGALDPANPAVFRMPLPQLASGKYVVKWTAVGTDGHRRTGDVRFTVK